MVVRDTRDGAVCTEYPSTLRVLRRDVDPVRSMAAWPPVVGTAHCVCRVQSPEWDSGQPGNGSPPSMFGWILAILILQILIMSRGARPKSLPFLARETNRKQLGDPQCLVSKVYCTLPSVPAEEDAFPSLRIAGRMAIHWPKGPLILKFKLLQESGPPVPSAVYPLKCAARSGLLGLQ